MTADCRFRTDDNCRPAAYGLWVGPEGDFQPVMTNFMSHFNIKRLIFASFFTATVLVLSHLPEGAAPFQLRVSGIDKVEHVLVYGTITLLFVLSLRTSSFPLHACLLFFAVLSLGAMDELTQALVSRRASFGDWLADAAGIGAVIVLSLIFKSALPRADPNNSGLIKRNHAEGDRALGLPHSDSVK